MRSPWNGGSISLRWRRCSGPSRIRIELGPTNGSRKLELAPARTTSAGAVNTARTSAGSETTTIGASVHAVRSVNGTPWRAALRRSSVVGRASHSQVWRARRGGRAGRQHRPDVTTCAGAARGGGAGRGAALAAELAGAQGEQLLVRCGGAERVGDGEAAVERRARPRGRRRPRRRARGVPSRASATLAAYASSSPAARLPSSAPSRTSAAPSAGWRAGSRPRRRARGTCPDVAAPRLEHDGARRVARSVDDGVGEAGSKKRMHDVLR